MTVSTIHQRLRDEYKLQVSISSFRRWVHATLPDEIAKSQVTVLRDDIEPGSEAQIDYGFLGPWTDPRTGKRHRVWAFVMVLPCSRHLFVRPVLHLDQHAWTEAHFAAFRYFGGVPRRLVPDNLKTGVYKPTSTTRRSTKPMPNSPRTTARWSILPGCEAVSVHMRAHSSSASPQPGAAVLRACGALRDRWRDRDVGLRPTALRPAEDVTLAYGADAQDIADGLLLHQVEERDAREGTDNLTRVLAFGEEYGWTGWATTTSTMPSRAP
ncbi:hypothetical protein [Streptomyces sp. NPDC051218]|uniref:hypothetical protein n=1 Tax=Streptomyces sp. NPDC051218 TaxID=3365645 RepID=UPI0037B9880A